MNLWNLYPNGQTDQLTNYKIKENFDLGGEEFLKFPKEAYDAFPR